ncbi:hypothetical protein A2382_00680 [Candidatus Woesebacteria bacterium RIFOXYB1_FULL_38_16]|uniref:Methyltransferase domain-containing protein n=1 Tax=Candidatus Woesebacteria bacterium RIFOXYB1_FULL_38_16 TaxID=1802538 RepID=A0A1F8CUN9_9BACT|nr:MAG: hypothetical protein A2191_02830 [Candidatus Woesebacteria bacterium RIFOXYA1_FULL_38_9]OGM79285.1 MAG: hypothetical protein A2382_00680 [Candidatus Woesebacteria bacterium RIFOXYB1_FULL_38_16]
MKIPQIDPFIGDEEYKAIKQCFVDKWITEGPRTKLLEEKLLGLIGAKYGVFAPNGTLSLYLALKAVGIGDGDEVIVPDFTFIASATSVIMAGAKPVFVDVNKDNFQIDVSLLKKLLNKHTKAIMPVHMYGTMCDMESVCGFAKENGLLVIEDAAQAIGVKYKGKHAGNWGDVGSFSFFADKTITMGEGGFVTTNNSEVYDKLLYLRNQGRKERGTFIHPEIGYNFRITDFHSAIGLVQFGKLPEIIKRKKIILGWYKEKLKGIEEVTMFRPFTGYDWIPFRVGLLANQAHQLMGYMESKGIQTRSFFYPLHKQPAFKEVISHLIKDSDFPNTCYAYDHGVCLPTYPTLTEDKVEYICSTIRSFYKERRDIFYKYYDNMFADKDYTKETKFIWEMTKTYGVGEVKKVLEIGAGTGNHTKEILKRDIEELFAVDIDPEMVVRLKKKLGLKRNLKIVEGEVDQLREKNFDLTLAMFNVVTYIDSEKQLKQFFSQVYSRLKPGGIFVFDVWNGVAAIKDPPKEKESKYKNVNETIKVKILPETDFTLQKVRLRYMFEIFKDNEIVTEGEYLLTQFLWMPRQLDLILKRVGFEKITTRSLNDLDKRSDSFDWKVVYVVQKPLKK